MAGAGLLGLGFVAFLRFIPPPAPSASAQEIAAHFLASPNLRRLGVLLLLAGTVLSLPIYLVLLDYFRRIEGGRSPLANLYMFTLAISTIGTWMCGFLWSALAFRPDQNPAAMQVLNDVAWYAATFPWFAIPQFVAMGLCSFRDVSETYFPRWFGWLNIWIAFIAVGGSLVIFFKDGAFAWNGILGFYLPLIAGVPWFIAVLIYLFKALRRDERELQRHAQSLGIAGA
jgi:hypothetical protein